MASEEVDIVNMALNRIGQTSITATQLTAATETVPSYCALHYAQCRDALQRLHLWRFNRGRIMLVSTWAASKAYTTDMYVYNDSVFYKCATAHTSSSSYEPPHAYWTTLTTAQVTPSFEYDYQFDLPADFLRRRYIWEDNDARRTQYPYCIEGNKYLTNQRSVYMVYSKKVTTVTSFDPLYSEVLTLQFARKIIRPITKSAKPELVIDIDKELAPLMRKVRQIDKQEQRTIGRGDIDTYNDAMYGWGLRDPTKLGSN